MNFQFVTYKRLIDNLENRVKTFAYSNLKPTKRIPWSKAYYRITMFSFQTKREDKNWRDFYRKLYNRYYQNFTNSEWRIPLERLAYKKHNKEINKLTRSEITYMCEKVYRVSTKYYERSIGKDLSLSPGISLLLFTLHKHAIEDLHTSKDSFFHDAIQIIVNRLYQANGYKRSLESVALQKANNCK